MPDLLLSASDQAALRYLLAAEPVQGRPLPGTDVLEHLARLIPCDAIGLILFEPDGRVVDAVALPHGHPTLDDPGCDGVRAMGIVHWAQVPGSIDKLRAEGLVDSLNHGFRKSRDRVAQLWFDRERHAFTPRDVTLLAMIAPTVHRLVRDSHAALPTHLTARERHALALVATGLSNPEIADRMGIATCTVRKHLEHAYRKLGVGNRHAAATVFTHPGAPAEVAERFA